MRKISYFIIGSFSFSILFYSVSSFSAESTFNPQLQLEGDLSSGENAYGLGVMLPFANESVGASFLDLRYFRNGNNINNASLGIGYRHSLSAHSYVGINSYYDAINANKNYDQVSVGLEYANQFWQAQANYYTPIGSHRNVLNEQYRADIQDGYLGIRSLNTVEELNDSADVEIGHILWRNKNSSMQVSAGSYWQEHNITDDNIGFRIKGEYDTNFVDWLPTDTNLGLGLYVEHDKEDDLRAGLQLKINLGTYNTFRSDIVQPVRRRLVTKTSVNFIHDFERAINYGKAQEFSYENTVEDVEKVNQEIENLGENGVAVMNGRVIFDDSLVIGESQTLLGNGSLSIVTKSGKKADYVNANPAIITNNSKSTSVIKVGSNSTIEGITLKGGSEGIRNLNDQTSNVHINSVDISKTSSDGIKLNNTNGLFISNSKIHDLDICENNSKCEFSVYSPAIAPNSAISAIGSSDIHINDVDINNVTYGIFLGNDYDANTNTYKTITSNVTINRTNISNSRREGLLLVGNENVVTNALSIDNSAQKEDMDLIVLQGSHNITMKNTNLSGGINGLMIVNSPNLPNYGENNINIKNMNITGTSRSGVFINPASNIKLENITVNNPGIAGLALYGNDWVGGPVENLTLTDFQVNNPVENTVVFFGPIKNIDGNIKTTQTKNKCANLWGMAQFEQKAGNTLTINGKEINNLDSCI